MGLTGFNRQRKRALSSELDIDEGLADKLMAFGYSTSKAVKDAESLPFLSDEELKHLNRKPKAKKQETKPVEEPKRGDSDGGDPNSELTGGPKANSEDLDEEFLALPDDTVFPHKINAGWHYLSNGEKVNGKAKAQKAQAQLDGE